ncbi:MAG TPA: acyltransferase [Solirubrobacteraceae bacterium]|jgi:acetyltransferase-like isoleucine patch superfamily enzyme|nr:acyltransferase [Solirubrobacteraceae bacterium]
MAQVTAIYPRRAPGGRARRVVAKALIKFLRPYLYHELAYVSARLAKVWGDPARLSIADTARVNDAFFNVESGTITVEGEAFFGFDVRLYAATHDASRLGAARQEAVPQAGHDIVVGQGAWLASNAIVIGPVVIGRHAVVAAGSVVTSDVGDYEVVAGVPARSIGRVPAAA